MATVQYKRRIQPGQVRLMDEYLATVRGHGQKPQARGDKKTKSVTKKQLP